MGRAKGEKGGDGHGGGVGENDKFPLSRAVKRRHRHGEINVIKLPKTRTHGRPFLTRGGKEGIEGWGVWSEKRHKERRRKE